ncbi:MAG: alpha-1,2-fucosyltransferase [Clostridium sp.]|nr:alpha-1,2-fucosyltransferase [Clostridium sp.]
MKVIHIESGLGNQMLSYCEYLAIKKMNPDDDVYIENIIFDIPECNSVVNQWNGYELQSVFGIEAPNIKQLFTEEQWQKILAEIRNREFWNRKWNYGVHFTEAFRHAGLDLTNTCPDHEAPGVPEIIPPQNPSLKQKAITFAWHHFLPLTYLHEYMARKRGYRILKTANYDFLFCQSPEDMYIGQRLDFKKKNAGIERIEKEIKQAFKFPALTDQRDIDAVKQIRSCNAVAIHARRGDMLGENYGLYATGYFKRAVGYIRKRTENPVFYIFTDPNSVAWCRDNARILGLNIKNDKIFFVDWNKGNCSFRDMQLMAECKHQVITNSTFGWWGAYFNTNPDKITCSPFAYINTTHTF